MNRTGVSAVGLLAMSQPVEDFEVVLGMMSTTTTELVGGVATTAEVHAKLAHRIMVLQSARQRRR